MRLLETATNISRNSAILLGWLFLLPSGAVAEGNRFTWHESDGSVQCSREFMENLSAADPIARIDAVTPSTIPSGSPDTQFEIMGTDLDKIPAIYVLDQNDIWFQCPFSKSPSSTRATVMIPSSYLTVPHFLLLSPAPDLRHAESVLVYSPTVAQAHIDTTIKISHAPEDIGSGGPIQVSGSGFLPGMKVVLGRATVAGVVVNTQVLSDSYLQADIPSHVPGDDLFIAVLGVDGRTRSAPVAVMSSYPEREDDFSQQASGPSPSSLNEEGLRLMRKKDYSAAAAKFVEAARLGPNNSSISASLAGTGGALFANNAGFAYFKMEKYEESVFWLKKAIEIDPKRVVSYLNLGDALVKLNRNAQARQAYTKYLELAPNSKSAADVKKKLDALPPSP